MERESATLFLIRLGLLPEIAVRLCVRVTSSCSHRLLSGLDEFRIKFVVYSKYCVYVDLLIERFSGQMGSVSTLRAIDKSPLSREQKRAVRRSYLGLAFKREPSSSSASVRVCGFDVHFCSWSLLKMLFKDVFVSNEYFFTSDTQRPVILDCGSNIGMSVLYFKFLYPDARITAFEPDSDACACLQKNVATNELRDVDVHQKAVARHSGPIDFFDDPALPGSPVMSTLADRGGPRRRVIDGVALSGFIPESVDMLKLDVEGAEIGVLQDLSESDSLLRIRRMVIEYHHHVSPGDDSLAAALAILEAAGFTYHIGARIPHRGDPDTFQDILISAYRQQQRHESA